MPRGLKALYEMPPEASVDWAVQEFAGESDRAVALVLATYLSHTLGIAILSKMTDRSAAQEDLLDDMKPLAELGSRVRMAHCLGLIGPQTKTDMLNVRKVRNVFAHSPHAITFEEPSISAVCGTLGGIERWQSGLLPTIMEYNPTLSRARVEYTWSTVFLLRALSFSVGEHREVTRERWSVVLS